MAVPTVDDADQRASATASVFAAVLERRVSQQPHLAAAPWFNRLDAAVQLRLLVTVRHARISADGVSPGPRSGRAVPHRQPLNHGGPSGGQHSLIDA